MLKQKRLNNHHLQIFDHLQTHRIPRVEAAKPHKIQSISSKPDKLNTLIGFSEKNAIHFKTKQPLFFIDGFDTITVEPWFRKLSSAHHTTFQMIGGRLDSNFPLIISYQPKSPTNCCIDMRRYQYKRDKACSCEFFFLDSIRHDKISPSALPHIFSLSFPMSIDSVTANGFIMRTINTYTSMVCMRV